MGVRVIHGDAIEAMRALAAEGVTVDAVVCDPPYLLEFMGRDFDRQHRKLPGANDGQRMQAWHSAWAALAFDLLKPGGYMVAFGGCRTYHRMVCAIEDAGFTIHPLLGWITGQGFPKATNLSKALDKAASAERETIEIRRRSIVEGAAYDRRPHREGKKYASEEFAIIGPATEAAKQWDGWYYGLQALKPALEPICLAQRPPDRRMVENIATHGTGALNIDGCRVATGDAGSRAGGRRPHTHEGYQRPNATMYQDKTDWSMSPAGRWPPNVIHSGDEEVLAAFAAFGTSKDGMAGKRGGQNGYDGGWGAYGERWGGFGGEGTPARFFPALPFSEDELRFMYHPKASRKERCGSRHPTVKPVALMKWLCRLVCPPGGTVLDPFAGSGTTGEAALAEGFNAILIEREAEYVTDIHARLERERSSLPLLSAAE